MRCHTSCSYTRNKKCLGVMHAQSKEITTKNKEHKNKNVEK
jgi:hypothetical protein